MEEEVPSIEDDPEMIRFANRVREAAQKHMDAYRSSNAILLEADINDYTERLEADPAKVYDFGDKKLTAQELLQSLFTDITVKTYVETPNPDNPVITGIPPLRVIAKVSRAGAF